MSKVFQKVRDPRQAHDINMLGLKIFVWVQACRRRSFAVSRNFCHPIFFWITAVWQQQITPRKWHLLFMCSFDTNVLPLYAVVQYVCQNQRHKKVVINILFFIFKAACPDEEDKFHKEIESLGKVSTQPLLIARFNCLKIPKKNSLRESGGPTLFLSHWADSREERIRPCTWTLRAIQLLCFLWILGQRSIRRERFTTGAI